MPETVCMFGVAFLRTIHAVLTDWEMYILLQMLFAGIGAFASLGTLGRVPKCLSMCLVLVIELAFTLLLALKFVSEQELMYWAVIFAIVTVLAWWWVIIFVCMLLCHIYTFTAIFT